MDILDHLEQERQSKLSGSRSSEEGYADAPATFGAKEFIAPTRNLIFALFLAMLFDALFRGRRLARLDRTEIYMLVFSIIVLANASLMSLRLLYSLRLAIDAFVIPFLAYFLARRLVTNEAAFGQLMRMLGYLGLYLILVVLVERIQHTDSLHRLQGPFNHRDHLYTVIVTIFFMALLDHKARLANVRQALPKFLRYTILGVAPLVVLATLTRGNLLGFFMAFWAWLFLTRHWTPIRRKMIRIGLAVLFIPVLLSAALALTPSEIVDQRLNRTQSIYSRLGAWLIQVQELAAHPFFGIGLNNLRDVLATQRVYVGGVKNETKSHNSYLAFAAELGLSGFLVYMAIAVSIWRSGLTLYRQQWNPYAQWHGVGIIALFVAYATPPLTSTLLYSPMVSHVYVYTCWGALIGLHQNQVYAAKVVRTPPRAVPARAQER